ncbi:MAG: ribbon-helix-helix domain-containing protein [Acidimicrobiales bacterium]
MGRTQIYLGDDELELLDRVALATGASRSELIRRAVRNTFGEKTKAERLRAFEASAGTFRGRRACPAAPTCLRRDRRRRLPDRRHCVTARRGPDDDERSSFPDAHRPSSGLSPSTSQSRARTFDQWLTPNSNMLLAPDTLAIVECVVAGFGRGRPSLPKPLHL